ncbi:MAG: hypothetical protein H6898_01265 [Rhodobacter sp.]|nr:hypothetical protein [Rhodobacter sp.]
MATNLETLLADPAMQRIIERNTRVYNRMTASQHRFINAVEAYVHDEVGDALSNDDAAERELYIACGKVWSDGGRVPRSDWDDVNDAIGNAFDADEWHASGNTFAGAARRIRSSILLKALDTKSAEDRDKGIANDALTAARLRSAVNELIAELDTLRVKNVKNVAMIERITPELASLRHQIDTLVPPATPEPTPAPGSIEALQALLATMEAANAPVSSAPVASARVMTEEELLHELANLK